MFVVANEEIIVKGFTDKDIQEAINFMSANGGGTVLLPSGTCLLRNAIYLKDNVKLVGQGSSTILKKAKGNFTYGESDIIKDDNKILVRDISNFKVGDGVMIFSNSLLPIDKVVTEIVEIKENCFILKDPFIEDISLTSNVIIYSSFPCIFCKNVNNVSIKNLSILLKDF